MIFSSVLELPDRRADGSSHRAQVGIIVDGWHEDARTFIDAVLRHTSYPVLVLTFDGFEYGHDRVEVFSVKDRTGWAKATIALLKLNPSAAHVVADISSVLDGDAITPLVDALGDGVVGAGWRGANVDTEDAWRTVNDASGEVDVLLSYLFAVDRDFALENPPHGKARFYRNADLEWSLAMREAGGRLLVPSTELPVHQERHHGYHDTDPEYRDRESRRTYIRLLDRFRGKDHILAPRS